MKCMDLDISRNASAPHRGGYVRRNALVGLRQPLHRASAGLWLPAGLYTVVAVVVVLLSGDIFPFSLPGPLKVVLLPPLLLLYPSLVEELVFRGLLLPRSLLAASPLRQFGAVTLSSLVFTAYHPLNHFLVGLSDTTLFVHPAFLLIVLALGYACGYAYLRTGSLRAPILIHWLTTVVWNLFLGR